MMLLMRSMLVAKPIDLAPPIFDDVASAMTTSPVPRRAGTRLGDAGPDAKHWDSRAYLYSAMQASQIGSVSCLI